MRNSGTPLLNASVYSTDNSSDVKEKRVLIVSKQSLTSCIGGRHRTAASACQIARLLARQTSLCLGSAQLP
jgi:hypothetical protein